MAVRVVRIMEYYYTDLAQANADMRRWQVPPSGERQFGSGTPGAPLEIVRSSVLGPQQLSADNTRDFLSADIGAAVPQAWPANTVVDDFAYRQQVDKHADATGVEAQPGFGEGRV